MVPCAPHMGCGASVALSSVLGPGRCVCLPVCVWIFKGDQRLVSRATKRTFKQNSSWGYKISPPFDSCPQSAGVGLNWRAGGQRGFSAELSSKFGGEEVLNSFGWFEKATQMDTTHSGASFWPELQPKRVYVHGHGTQPRPAAWPPVLGFLLPPKAPDKAAVMS